MNDVSPVHALASIRLHEGVERSKAGSEPGAIWALVGQILPLVALWIATHGYHGIIHDGRLYTVQALNALQPERFSGDLFFRYGSQDSFTFWTPLYAPLVGAIGPGRAHLAATIAGQAVWLSSALYLARTLFGGGKGFVFATAAIAALSPRYGGTAVFTYAEPFATPRVFAEAFVLVALALRLRGKWASSAASILGAGTLHPLMALSGAMVLAIYEIMNDRRICFLIVPCALAGLLLASLGVEPFTRAFITFDKPWFAIIWKRCAFGFLTRWDHLDYIRLTATCSSIVAALLLSEKAARRILSSVLIATILCLAASLCIGDLMRNVLVVNLQLWRVLWIAAVFSNAYVGVIAYRLPKGWISKDFLTVGILMSAASNFIYVPPEIYASLLIPGMAMIFWERRQGSALPALTRLLFLLAPAAAIWWSGFVVYEEITLGGPKGIWFDMVLALAAFVAVWLSPTTPPRRLVPVSLALLSAGILAYDHRSSWQQFTESDEHAAGLNTFVANSNNIYWEDGIDLQWIKLRSPSYYSCLQGAGAMFYRGTALEYEKRSRGLSGLNTMDFAADPADACVQKHDPKFEYPISASQIVTSCNDLPELDVIVLMHPVPGTTASVWKAPVTRKIPISVGKQIKIDEFYRYDCKDFRQPSRPEA